MIDFKDAAPLSESVFENEKEATIVRTPQNEYRLLRPGGGLPAGELEPGVLEAAFEAIRCVLPTGQPRAPTQFYALADLRNAFHLLQGPLAAAKDRGGMINPWALARLGYDEVRNANVLAGLWTTEFGGKTSRNFLAGYLSAAFPAVDWVTEVDRGYRVSTEVCPMGEASDRMDIIIETSRHLIGVEVKIRAVVDAVQLERYTRLIRRRAKLQNLSPKITLLAASSPDASYLNISTWADVARAAQSAINGSASDRSFVEAMVAAFGEHVQEF